jgi:hypothetical protein
VFFFKKKWLNSGMRAGCSPCSVNCSNVWKILRSVGNKQEDMFFIGSCGMEVLILCWLVCSTYSK